MPLNLEFPHHLSDFSIYLYVMFRCVGCCAEKGILLRCGRCKLVAYCSKLCQRSHWLAGHRDKCMSLETSLILGAVEVAIKSNDAAELGRILCGLSPLLVFEVI